jgi:beta-N-acetylhexosaminidase
MASAALYGFEGERLTSDEKSFFRDADAWGFILFARNVDRPGQVLRLTESLRDLMGRNVPVFIDQEGGRVQRLRPPAWRAAPAAARFGELWDREPELALEAVRLNHRLLGAELIAAGVDVDFAPCLDLPVPGAHDVIGDRALPPWAARRWRAFWIRACWVSSSMCPATDAPAPTATWSCRWWTPTKTR